MAATDHILIFINFWGLVLSPKKITTLCHSPANPLIAKSISRKIEELCLKYDLIFTKEEPYHGSIDHKIEGKLLEWDNFGNFFRQRVMEMFAEAKKAFDLPLCNMTYGESHGVFDTNTASQEDLKKLLNPTDPMIFPPK